MSYGVVLAGGSGTRFWPRSRSGQPKQLLGFGGGSTFLQATVRRLRGLLPPGRVLVATNAAYAAAVRQQLPDLPEQALVVEPAHRDTAAAVAFAALHILASGAGPGTVLVVAPSDHLVQDEEGFRRTVTAAIAAASYGRPLVTVGARPTRAETGFGYLRTGERLYRCAGCDVLTVLRFVEKPDRERARKFLREGGYLWNTGIFAWQVGAILGALGRQEPACGTALEGLLAELRGPRRPEIIAGLYARLPNGSVDQVVLEREPNLVCVPAAFGWDDLGTWSALLRVMPRDEHGNLIFGRVVALDTEDCIVDAGSKTVALIGVRDLVIVETADVLLVADRSRDQDVRELRERIRRAGLGHLL
jgi:mannose-1-phosphate guanylyltransferase